SEVSSRAERALWRVGRLRRPMLSGRSGEIARRNTDQAIRPRFMGLKLSQERSSGSLGHQGWLPWGPFQSACPPLPRLSAQGANGGPAPELFRMTREQLQARTKKALADMARQQGIAGWHGMS